MSANQWLIQGVRLCALVVLSSLFSSMACADQVKGTAGEPLPQCAALVKDCYASSGLARSNCFFSTSKHPFCEGTSLGDLVYKRWAMSPTGSTGPEAPPAFLGPQLIDQECLANFDSRFIGKLLQIDTAPSHVNQLEEELLKCAKEISDELTRP